VRDHQPGRAVDRDQALFLAARPPRAEVAIVYNPLAHFVGGRQRAAAYGGPQGEVSGIERDSLLGVHRALFPTNVPIDFVHIDHLGAGRLSQYKLVFLVYPPMLPEASAAALREYVEAGGVLVAEARLAWNNERGYAADRVPGLGLWEVMGVREAAVETAPGGRTVIVWDGQEQLPGVASGSRLPARWYKETLEPASPRARVVARFEDGSAAAVTSEFGRGRTLMLGSYVSAAYQSAPSPETARFYDALLAWAGVSRPVAVSGAALEVRSLDAGSDTLLFFFNHAREPARADVVLRVPAGPSAATDLVEQRTVSVSSTSEGVALTVELPPAGVRVLRMTRP